tara:strand:+ start:1435 stop:2082 length:648 start_codon:yes stop_codon:yes gene_type:complete
MSHNKIKAAGQSPDASANISIALNNLSDVDTSAVSSGDMLSYDGSSFVPISNQNSGLNLHAGIFQFSGGYGAGGYYFAINDYNCIRKNTGSARLYSSTGNTNIFNNATTTNTVVSTSVWMESIDVPTAGTYLCIAGTHCSTGTNVTWQWQNNSGNFGAKTYVQQNNNYYGGLVVAVMTATTNDIFRIVVTAKTGSIRLPPDEEQWMTGITIIKLG